MAECRLGSKLKLRVRGLGKQGYKCPRRGRRFFLVVATEYTTQRTMYYVAMNHDAASKGDRQTHIYLSPVTSKRY